MALRFVERALTIPALRERLKDVPSIARLAAAMALAGEALVYLGDSLLLERAQLVRRMYQLVDDSSCGAIVQGHPSRSQLLQAVGTLDSASQERWVEITATAIESQYGGRATPSVVTATVFKASLDKLLARSPRDIAQRLTIALGSLDSVSRPEACWAARTLYSRVLVAPPSERRVLVRGLVQR